MKPNRKFYIVSGMALDSLTISPAVEIAFSNVVPWLGEVIYPWEDA
jgi:hypothetical protein